MWLGWRNVIRERLRPGPRWSVAALTLAVALSPAADPLDDARARVAAARDAADAATARYHDAQTRHAEVVLAIEELEAAIRSGRDRASLLRTRVQQLAVTAYTTAGGSVPLCRPR